MSNMKEEVQKTQLERLNSRGSINGSDVLKRGREGETEDDQESISKRPDLRNPFARVDKSGNSNEDLHHDQQKPGSEIGDGPNEKPESKKNENLSVDEDKEDSTSATPSDVKSGTSSPAPAALLRRMSLENKRAHFYTSAVPSLVLDANEEIVTSTEDVAACQDQNVTEHLEKDGQPSEPQITAAESCEAEKATIKDSEVSSQTPELVDAVAPCSEASSTFIFGQNLSSRVANVILSGSTFPSFSDLSDPKREKSSSGFGGFGSFSDAPPPGFLFAQALQQVSLLSTTKETPSSSGSITENGVSSGAKELEDGKGLPSVAVENGEKVQGETLKESAKREYDARPTKPVLEQVDVVTGEEAETNVFEVNVKLHVFDKDSQQWKERGRAVARLNDAHDNSYSRLVIRMAGTLRVIVNTKLWKEMSVSKLSDRNVSFSAFDTTDDNSRKVFLISSSTGDAQQFYSELKSRIQRLKAEQKAAESVSVEQTPGQDELKPSPGFVDLAQPTKKPKWNDDSVS